MGWLYLFIFTLSYTLTWALRRYALEIKMVDIPNDRSSHVVPTPRGGGLSFVVCFLISVSYLYCCNFISFNFASVLLGAGFFTSLIGFLDDRKDVSAKWRLAGHFLVCGFTVYGLGGMPAIEILGWSISAGLISNILAILYLVWLLNLYNFMDGIDGIAAIEALSVCLGGALLYYLSGNNGAMLLPLSLAMAVGGFLFWNLPPAKIFMGDVGSGFLGVVLGILSIQAVMVKTNFFWSWLILLGVFIVDATVTLFLRGLRREILFEAHCSHAYQHASRYYGKHLPVTLGVLAINLFWLLPMAVAVGFDLIEGSIGVLITYLPLIILTLKFKSGKKK